MGLYENLQVEPVSRLALRPAILVGRTSSVYDVVIQMREGRLGCAIVVDEERRPLGVFNEAMLRTLMADSPATLSDKVESHMATTFPWVEPTDAIEMVLNAMEEKNARFVVVVDHDGRVTGLTGQKGLMEYVAEHFPGEVMVQRVGTESYPDSREGA